MAKRVRGGLALLVLLALAGPGVAPEASGQKAEQDKEKEKMEAVVNGLFDAYRAADYNLMTRYYAPEVVMVSARYEPPLVGWANVQRAYLAQEAGLKRAEIGREGTIIERRGKFAWVYYRWSFVGLRRDQYLTTAGHTTLILEKRGRDWLVVYNHSSAITPPAARPNTPATPAGPAR